MKQITQWFKNLFRKTETNSNANISKTANAIPNPSGPPPKGPIR